MTRSLLLAALLALGGAARADSSVTPSASSSTSSTSTSSTSTSSTSTSSASPSATSSSTTPTTAPASPTVSPAADEAVEGAKNSKPESHGKPDDSLEQYRTPFDALTERTIGSASRAVRFDWRKSKFGLELLGGQLLELNNFITWRVGVVGRVPMKGIMLEFGANVALTSGSDSTDKLSATPYRQVGRPSRLELDVDVSYPLAEGVATPRTNFLPTAELVLSATAGLRYLYYQHQFHTVSVKNGALDLVKPQLTSQELDNLESQRLPAMEIDKGRYDVLAGITFDVYVQSGGFISPRVMIAPPITESGLGWWWELSLAAGWMF